MIIYWRTTQMQSDGLIKLLDKKFDYSKEEGKFFWKNTEDEAGYTTSDGYRAIKLNGKEYRVHQLVFLKEKGYIPEAIDHKDHNRQNNVISNLRPTTHKENARNQSRNSANSSGFTGVSLYKPTGKWEAKIKVDGKQIHLGYFETKEEAIAARIKANDEYGFHDNHGAPSEISSEEFLKNKKDIVEYVEEKDTESEFDEEVKSSLPVPDMVTDLDKLTEEDLLMPSVLPPQPLTLTERYIAELYAKGLSSKKIATVLGLRQQVVSRVLQKPELRNFVTELVNAQYTTIKEGRLRVLNKIIEDKLEALEREYDGDLSSATKKDIVDLIQIVDNMLKEKEKAELGTGGDTYVNILQQIIK